MADRGVYSVLEVFRKGPDPATTLDCFEKYVKRANLVFATAATTIDDRELKQTDAAAANLQISIEKDSRPSEFSRPLTSITLNLNGD